MVKQRWVSREDNRIALAGSVDHRAHLWFITHLKDVLAQGQRVIQLGFALTLPASLV
jgi:hypothetical protein